MATRTSTTPLGKSFSDDYIKNVTGQLGVSEDQLWKMVQSNPSLLQQGQGGINANQNWNTTPGQASLNLTALRQMAAGQSQQAQPAAQAATTPAASYWGQDPQINQGGASGANSGGSSTTSSGLQPEQIALQQMAQIDPTSEALRNQLGMSYLQSTTPGMNQPVLPNAPVQGAPSAKDIQSYLDTYNQIDPTGLAGRKQLEQQLTSQAALGSQLDPETAREVEQQTRLAQTARGNVYGTPQLVEEAMTRGQAGLALQQQRQQALQGFLQSGQDVGSVANNLYQQGQQNYLNQYANYFNAFQGNQANQRANQSAALSYLTSGATPYQVGASYMDRAQSNAAQAAQGGPQYNPTSLGQSYTGTGTAGLSQYGLDQSQNANQWYNSLSAYTGGGGTGQNRGMNAMSGAASGALSGATAGTTIMPGWGTLIGGALGAVAGGVSGYAR